MGAAVLEPRRSLSLSILLLTVTIVLATAVLVFVPGLVRERREWLSERLTQAHVAALAAAAAPGGRVDDRTRDELLRLAGASSIRVLELGRGELALAPVADAPPRATIDLRLEDGFTAARRALEELVGSGDGLVRVTGTDRFRGDAVVELTLGARALSDELRDYAWQSAEVAVTIAVVTGAIVYVALLRLLVRPMRRLTDGIRAFRADPEHAAPIQVSRSPFAQDEVAVAQRELAAMQGDLRAALWRNARLAAIGTAMAQVSHDLRGILSPALLVADTLQEHPDPAIGRAGDMVARVVDRATGLARSMLDFARDGPPAPERRPVLLRKLLDEAIELLPGSTCGCELLNEAPGELRAEADREMMLRVLLNLCRNACEAGARRVRVTAAPLPAADGAAPAIGVDVEDDGPGLPDRVQATLFRPFSASAKQDGTGLGLAIARDLVRAQGGELELLRTGPDGAAFRIVLPAAAEAALPGA